jgi:hypothetical protein
MPNHWSLKGEVVNRNGHEPGTSLVNGDPDWRAPSVIRTIPAHPAVALVRKNRLDGERTPTSSRVATHGGGSLR